MQLGTSQIIYTWKFREEKKKAQHESIACTKHKRFIYLEEKRVNETFFFTFSYLRTSEHDINGMLWDQKLKGKESIPMQNDKMEKNVESLLGFIISLVLNPKILSEDYQVYYILKFTKPR